MDLKSALSTSQAVPVALVITALGVSWLPSIDAVNIICEKEEEERINKIANKEIYFFILPPFFKYNKEFISGRSLLISTWSL
jgi:hypothetical protein